MSERRPECPQCKRRMEPGFVLDHGASAVAVSTWVGGTPEWSRWSGLKLKDRVQLPVTTFRCPGCGRLESFARPA